MKNRFKNTTTRLNWFDGKTLLETLDALKLNKNKSKQSIISVQMIQRLAGGGRRYLGRVLSGEVSINKELYVSSSRLKITTLLAAGEETKSAKTDSAISFEIDKDLDIQRGDALTSEQKLPHDQFEVDMIWLSGDKGYKGRKYLMNANSSETNMSITKINSIDRTTNSNREKNQILAPMKSFVPISASLTQRRYCLSIKTLTSVGSQSSPLKLVKQLLLGP